MTIESKNKSTRTKRSNVRLLFGKGDLAIFVLLFDGRRMKYQMGQKAAEFFYLVDLQKD